MKKFLKIIKIVLTVLFFSYSIIIVYFVGFSSKDGRFKVAEHAQGMYLSQKMFDILIFQNADNSDLYFEKSVAFNKMGQYAKGSELLDKAVQIDPKIHLGYRGWLKLRKLRSFDNALKDFDRLDKLTPNVIDAPWGEDIDFLRGECYYGKKEYQKAIDMFNRSIKNQKEDWADIHTFVYLGLCEYELGNYEKAISEFDRALQQSQTTPESYLGMAKAYHKLGDIQQAKNHVSKAEEYIESKRDDVYNELLNEIYLSDVIAFKESLNN
ncbi:tetratricopeptide repeat protein [Aquimarina sp. AU474]|uniref:tetratricopeptide repeat protein n=1 Tax=Aquimarina sp. AU474 TaxID=2108529 RepID=UPI000D698D22|nr:tetratricopeptide repeat protein [Aquimarina sp. AU474]